jgi:hypothetical protein
VNEVILALTVLLERLEAAEAIRELPARHAGYLDAKALVTTHDWETYERRAER